MQKFLEGAALFLVLSAGVQQARAMEILWGTSGFDSAEITVLNEAINQWEQLIYDNNTTNNRLVLHISKASLSSGILGQASGFAVEEGTNSPTLAAIQINQNVSWYVDSAPADHGEYNGTLLSDYYFSAPYSSPAYGHHDLLSVVLHEIGHTIGFAKAYSDWFSFDQLSMGLHLTGDQSHADPSYHFLDFMAPGIAPSERRIISDLDLSALARAFDYQLTPDIDRDGDVDTADLTKMLQNFTGDVGAAGNLTHKSGDLDADGDVDTGDLTFALQNFTGTMDSALALQLADLQADLLASSPGTASDETVALTAIPEPSSFALLALGMVGLVVARRRPKNVGLHRRQRRSSDRYEQSVANTAGS